MNTPFFFIEINKKVDGFAINIKLIVDIIRTEFNFDIFCRYAPSNFINESLQR